MAHTNSNLQEGFLHFIWQHQYFDKRELLTTSGDRLQVIRPGLYNQHAGPDFSNAKIKIGLMSWAGTVEIHVKSSGWRLHKHQVDQAYDSVILHVVWQDDEPVSLSDGSLLPTLELRNRVDKEMLSRYKQLVGSSLTIPCARSLNTVRNVTRLSMIERSLAERLERKALTVLELLNHNGNDWRETAYQLLARNFGFKVNGDPFFQLAKGLPNKYLDKHANSSLQVEALVFGQAGFLDEKVNHPYHKLLRREYALLGRKYQLTRYKLKSSQWKFLRLRPANFPTIRLSQFCALMVSEPNFFARVLELSDYKSLHRLIQAEQSAFWKEHYTFSPKQGADLTRLGSSSVDSIIINTVAPLLVAYGRHHDEQSLIDRAQTILESTPPEENSIIRSWRDLGQETKNAFDSQALIQLFDSYCTARRCLDCVIGAALLKPG